MSIITAITALTVYSLMFGVVLTIMWGAWRLSGLRHQTDFALNRAVLMGAVIFAAAAAALPFVITPTSGVTESITPVSLIAAGETATAVTAEVTGQAPARLLISLGDLTAVYIIGLIVSLMMLVGKLIYVWCVIWRAKAADTDMTVKGVRLRSRGSSAPFTWGRWIVMSEHDYATHRRAILAHEEVHRRQGHWIDLMVLRAAGALTWYLPVVPMMRRDLVQCHEYAADAGVISSGIDPEAYQMMLIECASGRRFNNPLVNSFNFCSIKNRIIMMQNKQRKAASAWARALTFIPAVVLTIAAASTPALASAVQNVLPKEEAFTPAASEVAAATDEVFTTVEIKPEYKGGAEKMFSDLATRLRYPEEAARQNIQGRVVVQFIVEKDG
ncbi:MAG: energy transducer TonB, partial [Muribaculaceae bacterium]|nr:energy transducer TonB [Muribaculaceae bacterium]